MESLPEHRNKSNQGSREENSTVKPTNDAISQTAKIGMVYCEVKKWAYFGSISIE